MNNYKHTNLTTNQALNKLKQNGKNQLIKAKKKNVFALFLSQLANPMIVVLIVSAIFSYIISLYSKEGISDVIIILTVVFLNSLLGVIQEAKAEKAINALNDLTPKKSTVIRDNEIKFILSEDLVTDDIVIIESGDIIPADGILLENHSLKIDESTLTGLLDPSKVKGNIEFNHVKFGYNEDREIIKDFSCKIKPGEKIAIVGPTGAGKTTIVNLLMKFYEVNSGEIKIDDMPLSNLTRENIHDLFIMVLQDTWLFEGTIRDNIKFNKENVTDKQIWEALKVVGVDHFVKSLPKTLDYKLGDNESVSAGQKQLLTIARGMIKDSPFLILDEATSSVDTRTEELVQKAMDKLTEGRTSFIIAHRLSTIKNADLILVMKDGNIIETGNHDELIQKNGFYAELYNSQFQ